MFSRKHAWRWLGCLIGLGFLGACTHPPDGSDDPRRRLNDYISQSFAIKGPQDRRELSAFLTGEAKTRLDSWSDEQFIEAFIEAKRQFLKLAFKEIKNVSPAEMGITYELSYETRYADRQGKTHDAKVTNRKLAQLVRKEGKWFISDVRNIKEVMEYKDEMALP